MGLGDFDTTSVRDLEALRDLPSTTSFTPGTERLNTFDAIDAAVHQTPSMPELNHFENNVDQMLDFLDPTRLDRFQLEDFEPISSDAYHEHLQNENNGNVPTASANEYSENDFTNQFIEEIKAKAPMGLPGQTHTLGSPLSNGTTVSTFDSDNIFASDPFAGPRLLNEIYSDPRYTNIAGKFGYSLTCWTRWGFG